MRNNVFGTARKEVIPLDEQRSRRRGDRGFGLKCRQHREDAGLTIQGFVEVAGDRVNAGEVRAVEDGKRASVEWPRFVHEATGADYVELFDVWDRESPGGADRMTVSEGKTRLERMVRQGDEVICPCCARTAKARRRSFSPAMASFAVWVVRAYRGEPLDVNEWAGEHPKLARGGDYAKALHWGLVERVDGKEARWRPTLKGTKWARGQILVHRAVVLWRNNPLEFTGALVGIKDVLPNEHPVRGAGQSHLLPGMENP